MESAGEAVGLFERRVKGDLERDEGGRHVHFALSVQPGQLDELVRELTAQGVGHKGPIEHEGGDRSLYFEDPEGNVVEAWDFFERGEGARDGVEALT